MEIKVHFEKKSQKLGLELCFKNDNTVALSNVQWPIRQDVYMRCHFRSLLNSILCLMGNKDYNVWS